MSITRSPVLLRGYLKRNNAAHEHYCVRQQTVYNDGTSRDIVKMGCSEKDCETWLESCRQNVDIVFLQ